MRAAGRIDSHLILLGLGVWLVVFLGWLAAAWAGYPQGGPEKRASASYLAALPISLGAAGFSWQAARSEGASGLGRRAWRCIALALAAYGVGHVLLVWHVWRPDDVPLLVAGLASYTLFYPVMLAGLVSFPHARRSRADWSTFWLDSAVVLVGSGMLMWHFIVFPIMTANVQDPIKVNMAVSMPVMDMVLILGVLKVALGAPELRSRQALTWIVSGLVLFTVGDIMFEYFNLTSVYMAGDPIDGVRAVAQALILVGAYVQARRQPWTRADARGSESDEAAEPSRFGWLPYAAVAGASALLLSVSRDAAAPDLPDLVLGAVILTGLVVARQALAQRQNAALLAAAAARHTEARFRSLVQNASDLIMVVAPGNRLTYQSPSVRRVLGYAAVPDTAMGLASFALSDDVPRLQAYLAEAAREGGAGAALEWRMRHKDGSWRTVETVATNLLDDPDVGGLVLNTRDVTERKELEAQLIHQAFHDSLTGLANRALFHDRLAHAISQQARRVTNIAVLFVDLDNFKTINDSLGHGVGDELLTAFSERVRACVRPGDTVGRLGGDEFALLLEDIDGLDAARAAAARLLAALQVPFSLANRHIVVKASIGIAIADEPHLGPDDLLRDADLALYAAKGNGKGRYEVFDIGMQRQAQERLDIEADMRSGLQRSEFRVFYQPILSLATGRIVEFEALVRWQHPNRGLLAPLEFISVAEESGLIVSLGLMVLEEACRQAQVWRTACHSSLGMSVNLSARQFRDPNLLGSIQRVLAKTGLDPAALKLEITESLAMQDAVATARVLEHLKGLGIRFASPCAPHQLPSLSYLKLFPIDTLKIDKSFIDDLPENRHDVALVAGIVAMAKNLGLSVTVEGIELEEQRAQLRALGCDRGQGYLFSQPLPPEALEPLLVGERNAEQLAA